MKRINGPDCRQADSDVNIWTVPQLNFFLIGLRIQWAPVFSSWYRNRCCSSPARESSLIARPKIWFTLPTTRKPFQLLANGSRTEVTALLFFSSGAACSAGSTRVRQEQAMTLHTWCAVFQLLAGSVAFALLTFASFRLRLNFPANNVEASE